LIFSSFHFCRTNIFILPRTTYKSIVCKKLFRGDYILYSGTGGEREGIPASAPAMCMSKTHSPFPHSVHRPLSHAETHRNAFSIASRGAGESRGITLVRFERVGREVLAQGRGWAGNASNSLTHVDQFRNARHRRWMCDVLALTSLVRGWVRIGGYEGSGAQVTGGWQRGHGGQQRKEFVYIYCNKVVMARLSKAGECRGVNQAASRLLDFI